MTPQVPTPSIHKNPAPHGELLAAMARVKRPLIVGHVTPDADCVGSCMGLASALREHAAQAEFAVPEGDVAKRISFLIDMLARRDWVSDGRLNGHDAVIVIDTAGANRMNAPFKIDQVAGLPVLNIDHHLSNPGYGQVNWIDPHASSSAEMIARLIAALDWPFSKTTASLLYAGIHGDTAGFSLPNTTSDTLHVAAELVRAGADVGFIGERLCRWQVRSDFEVLRHVYDHTQLTPCGRIAYSHLSHDEIITAGCKPDDIDDQVSVPRSLAGIRIALLFSEAEKGIVRINLRGESGTPVLPIAQQLGGGGHALSAGVRVRNKPMPAVIADVVAAAARYLDSMPK